ncbi:MAG: hypothetical protein WED07_02480 [Candidatus Freyarchaeum deiterrae]
MVGQFLVTQKSFAAAFKMRRWSAIIAGLVGATIAGWLGLRFLYYDAYWWAAWTMAMVFHVGIFNTTILTSYYVILQYLGIPDLLVYLVIYYIWIFYGVFAQSVMPYFIILIFTSIPYTVLGIIFLALKSKEEGKSGWFGGEGKPWGVSVFPRGFGAAVLSIIQLIAIIELLTTNLWAQLYLGVTYFTWAYTDLLITIFLPLALVVFIPAAIVWGVIWGATKLHSRQSNQS